MNESRKKKIIVIASIQVLIMILSFVFYKKMSLLSYINISFYISSALLFTSLFIFTIHSGFFDIVARSFNFALTRGQDKKKFWDITPLSELITIDQKPLVFHGLLIGFFMLIALVIYYF